MFLVLTGLTAALPAFVFSAETNRSSAKPHLPSDVKHFLLNAGEFTLFFLKPEPDFSHKSKNTFGNYPILGRTKIKVGTERTSLVEALEHGIANGGGIMKCFNPRHTIRAKKNGETIECLICFECRQIRACSSKGTKWDFVTSGEPAANFNHILK